LGWGTPPFHMTATSEEAGGWLESLAQLSSRFFAPSPAPTTGTAEDTATDETRPDERPNGPLASGEQRAAKETFAETAAPSAPSAAAPVTASVPAAPPVIAPVGPPLQEPPASPPKPPPPALPKTPNSAGPPSTPSSVKSGEVRLFLKRHPETKQLGFTFGPDSTGVHTVTDVIKGHSAEGKIFVGDRLLGIDGVRLGTTCPLDEAKRLIQNCREELVGLVLEDQTRTIIVDTAGDKLGVDLEVCPYPRPVRIYHVATGSPAAMADILVGDLVVAVNGTRTCDRDQCIRLIAEGKANPLKLQIRTLKKHVSKDSDSGIVAGVTAGAARMVRSLSFSKRNKKAKAEEGTPPLSARKQSKAEGTAPLSARKQSNLSSPVAPLSARKQSSISSSEATDRPPVTPVIKSTEAPTGRQ